MRTLRLLLAALAVLSAPGERAYAQFSKAVPVRSAPVAPAAPVQLHLPAGGLTPSLGLPSVAPTLTAPALSLPTPSASLRAPVAAAPSVAAVAASLAPIAAAVPTLTRPALASSVAQRDSPSTQQADAKTTLQAGAAALKAPGAAPAAALDSFFAGAKDRSGWNAVSPEGEPGRPMRPGLMARSPAFA
ncbi:MAG: hypothetical protein FD126_226, partial [Elusimicrobia bacterium]